MPNIELLDQSKELRDSGGDLIIITGSDLSSIPSDYVYSARLRKNGTSTYSSYLYSTQAGQGIYSKKEGSTVFFGSPTIAPGNYDLILEYGPANNPDSSDFELLNCIVVKRANKAQETYDLRAGMPPRFSMGARELSKDPYFAYDNNALRSYQNTTNFELLSGVIGDTLNELKGSLKTVVTSDIYLNAILGSEDEDVINVESTYGLSDQQYLYIEGDLFRLISWSNNQLHVQSYNPFKTISAGSEVTYAIITD